MSTTAHSNGYLKFKRLIFVHEDLRHEGSAQRGVLGLAEVVGHESEQNATLSDTCGGVSGAEADTYLRLPGVQL